MDEERGFAGKFSSGHVALPLGIDPGTNPSLIDKQEGEENGRVALWSENPHQVAATDALVEKRSKDLIFLV